MGEPENDFHHTVLKQALRRKAQLARAGLSDSAQRSQRALNRLQGIAAYTSASAALHYVSARSELATHTLVQAELAGDRQEVHIPWCHGEELELFRLQSWDELAPGAFGILEPLPELRELPERRTAANAMEVILVPGVAFDRRGGRLGHGKGYYDRLLARAARHTVFIGLCFTCQLVDEVPRDPHDVAMHWLVSEDGVIECGS